MSCSLISKRCHRVRVGTFIIVLALCAGAAGAKQATHSSFHANEKVMAVLEGIQNNMWFTKYQAATRVNPQHGEYLFDCSGMAAWVLARAAPDALRSLGRPNGFRPLAVHFYRKIAHVPLGRQRGPWHRVESVAHAQPGDIIAWKRPKWFRSKSTGHVAFVVSAPQPLEGEFRGFLVRIADASKFKHQLDSRPDDVTGFGSGVILLPTDPGAQPLGYGWFGTQTPREWISYTHVVIGRALR